MAEPIEHRDRAAICLQKARAARSFDMRTVYLAMAETWLLLADRAARLQGLSAMSARPK